MYLQMSQVVELVIDDEATDTDKTELDCGDERTPELQNRGSIPRTRFRKEQIESEDRN